MKRDKQIAKWQNKHSDLLEEYQSKKGRSTEYYTALRSHMSDINEVIQWLKSINPKTESK